MTLSPVIKVHRSTSQYNSNAIATQKNKNASTYSGGVYQNPTSSSSDSTHPRLSPLSRNPNEILLSVSVHSTQIGSYGPHATKTAKAPSGSLYISLVMVRPAWHSKLSSRCLPACSPTRVWMKGALVVHWLTGLRSTIRGHRTFFGKNGDHLLDSNLSSWH